MSSARNNLIYNNTFYNNWQETVMMRNDDARTDTGNRFYNNIFYKNFQDCDLPTPPPCRNSSGYVQGSQISWQDPGISVSTFEGYGNKVDYNFIQYFDINYSPIMHFYLINTYLPSLSEAPGLFPSTIGTHNIQGASGPRWVSEPTRDFHLVAGSVCIDAGVVVTDTDWGNLSYSGVAPDIGAYEYAGAPPPDTTPPSAPSGVTVS